MTVDLLQQLNQVPAMAELRAIRLDKFRASAAAALSPCAHAHAEWSRYYLGLVGEFGNQETFASWADAMPADKTAARKASVPTRSSDLWW